MQLCTTTVQWLRVQKIRLRLILRPITTTDVYVQQLNKEYRESLDVPDATDITISKRKWEKAVNRFRTHIRDVYMRQLAEDLELWELNSNVEDCISRMACEDHTPIGQALTLYLHACLLPLCLALLAQGRGYNRVRHFQRARGYNRVRHLHVCVRQWCALAFRI